MKRLALLALVLACSTTTKNIPPPTPPPVPPTPVVVTPPVAPGSWVNVTPSNANVTDALSCDNYGVHTVGVDPARPTNFYAHFYCQGVWHSADAGLTWTGPIDANATAKDCAGGIAVARGAPGAPPIVYRSCIRGAGLGFWRSTDGGVNWTKLTVGQSGTPQDYYPAAVDPYDSNHLLMAGHERNTLVESLDAGQTWRTAPLDPAMNPSGGTAGIFFIDTGSSTSTRTTWLWISQGTGGNVGTWRTISGGTPWTRVDSNEHPHGAVQIYQAGPVVYMAGEYSAKGQGVLRSADYGQTWEHVGSTQQLAVAWGASGVYAGFGWAHGRGSTDNPQLEMAQSPGTTWTAVATPTGMVEGPSSVAIGGHVFVMAAWQAGLWRYVEPTP